MVLTDELFDGGKINLLRDSSVQTCERNFRLLQKFIFASKWNEAQKKAHRGYSRFKVGAIVECMFVDVIDHRVIQQIFNRESASDEPPSECGWDFVRNPICDNGDIAPVLAEQIGVKDKLLGVAAVSGDDDEAMLTQDCFQLLAMQNFYDEPRRK